MSLPRLLFVHVPKTGGIALFDALERAYGREHSLRIDNLPEPDSITPEALQRHRLVSGHATYPELLGLGLGEYLAVSVVRDPVDRSISSYHYARSLPDHPLYAEFIALSPEDWTRRMESHPPRHRHLHHLAGATTFADARPLLDRYALLVPYEDMSGGVARIAALVGCGLTIQRLNVTDKTGAEEFTDSQRKRIRAGLAEDYRVLDYARERWVAQAA